MMETSIAYIAPTLNQTKFLSVSFVNENVKKIRFEVLKVDTNNIDILQLLSKLKNGEYESAYKKLISNGTCELTKIFTFEQIQYIVNKIKFVCDVSDALMAVKKIINSTSFNSKLEIVHPIYNEHLLNIWYSEKFFDKHIPNINLQFNLSLFQNKQNLYTISVHPSVFSTIIDILERFLNVYFNSFINSVQEIGKDVYVVLNKVESILSKINSFELYFDKLQKLTNLSLEKAKKIDKVEEIVDFLYEKLVYDSQTKDREAVKEFEKSNLKTKNDVHKIADSISNLIDNLSLSTDKENENSFLNENEKQSNFNPWFKLFTLYSTTFVLPIDYRLLLTVPYKKDIKYLQSNQSYDTQYYILLTAIIRYLQYFLLSDNFKTSDEIYQFYRWLIEHKYLEVEGVLIKKLLSNVNEVDLATLNELKNIIGQKHLNEINLILSKENIKLTFEKLVEEFKSEIKNIIFSYNEYKKLITNQINKPLIDKVKDIIDNISHEKLVKEFNFTRTQLSKYYAVFYNYLNQGEVNEKLLDEIISVNELIGDLSPQDLYEEIKTILLKGSNLTNIDKIFQNTTLISLRQEIEQTLSSIFEQSKNFIKQTTNNFKDEFINFVNDNIKDQVLKNAIIANVKKCLSFSPEFGLFLLLYYKLDKEIIKAYIDYVQKNGTSFNTNPREILLTIPSVIEKIKQVIYDSFLTDKEKTQILTNILKNDLNISLFFSDSFSKFIQEIIQNVHIFKKDKSIVDLNK